MIKTDCIYFSDNFCYFGEKLHCDDCLYYEEVIKLG